MSYEHIAARLFNRPLLVLPTRALVLADFITARKEGRAPAAYTPTAREEITAAVGPVPVRRAADGYFVTRDGVAIVQMIGTLTHRGGFMQAESGLLDYGTVANRVASAELDSDVKAILLEVDSPGGESSGCMDLAQQLESVTKPVWAHANEFAASAAYWVSSAANQMYMARSGLVGSIGVYALHIDESGLNERVGLAYEPVFAGQKKVDGAPWAPLSQSARQDWQDEVDDLYGLFVDAVARNRGISAATVRATEAALYNAPDAVRLGLVDGIASLSETVQTMTRSLKNGTASARSALASGQVPRHEATAGMTTHTREAMYESRRAQAGHVSPQVAGAETDEEAGKRIAGYANAERQAQRGGGTSSAADTGRAPQPSFSGLANELYAEKRAQQQIGKETDEEAGRRIAGYANAERPEAIYASRKQQTGR